MTKFAFVLFALVSSAAFAGEETAPNDYYRVANVSVREVVPTAEEMAVGYLTLPLIETPKAGVLDWVSTVDWNAMQLLGEKVLQIVKAGAPVVNIKRDTVAVVPAGVTAWQQLAGWQAPVVKAYEVKVTNYLGADVVDLRLKVSASWGGGIDGRGKYLANVQVVPSSTRVLWGWSLDLWTENQEPVNAGSFENPVAALGFEVRYKVTTMLNEMNGAQSYYITGAGEMLAL